MDYLFARFLLGFHGFGAIMLGMSLFPPLEGPDSLGGVKEEDFNDLQQSRIVVDSVLPMLSAAMMTLATHNIMTGVLATDRSELSRGLTVVVVWNLLGFFWHVRHLEVYDGMVPPWVVNGTEIEFYYIPMFMMLLYATLTALAEIWLAFETPSRSSTKRKKAY